MHSMVIKFIVQENRWNFFFSQNKLRWYIIASSKAKLAQVIMNSLHKSSSLLLAQANARNIQMEQDYMRWYKMICKVQEIHKRTQLRKENTHQAPPSTVQRLLDLRVWWGYRLAGSGYQHGRALYHPSLGDLSESDISHLCAWFLSEELGFWQQKWHWCYHKAGAL